MNKVAAGAAWVLLAFGSSAAFAGATSTATLNGLTVTLYDLNPGHGVAPSISFSLTGGLYGSYARTSASDGTAGSQTGNTWSLQAFGPTSASSVARMVNASASVSGTLSGGLVLGAQGSAPGTTVLGFSTDYSSAASVPGPDYFYGAISFTLSPNTLAVFGGSYSLFAQTTVGQVYTSPPYTSYTESASSSVSIIVSGTGASGTGTQQSTQNQSINANYVSVYNPQTGQFTYTGQTLSVLNAPLAASFTNASSSALGGTLALSVGVIGNSRILAAVPEPSTYLLALAGAAALIARRRRG